MKVAFQTTRIAKGSNDQRTLKYAHYAGLWAPQGQDIAGSANHYPIIVTAIAQRYGRMDAIDDERCSGDQS